MEAKIEKLEDSKVKAVVTAEAKEVDSYVGKTYKDLARQYSFPGFRKGKAPRPVIDNAVGRESVLAAATEDLVNGLYPQVVEEQGLFPVASPDFGDIDPVKPGEPFTFEVTITVKPELELSSYDPVEVEIPFEKATEKEIDSQVDALRNHYKSYENAPAATKLTADRAADLTIKATKEDGEEVGSLTSESLLYNLGTGLYAEALDKELEGIKKGENRTFTVDVPEDESAMLMADLRRHLQCGEDRAGARADRRVGEGDPRLRHGGFHARRDRLFPGAAEGYDHPPDQGEWLCAPADRAGAG